MADTHDFTNPWRAVYEWPMAGAWFGASVVTLVVATALPVPAIMAVGFALATGGMGAWRTLQAIKRREASDRIRFNKQEFIDFDTFVKIASKAAQENSFWLGKGFRWTDVEANRMYALVSAGLSQTIGSTDAEGDTEGSSWIHGLAEEHDLFADLGVLVGHTLLVGTTRVGKTVMLILLICQAIVRGEPVIIVDPKGDKRMITAVRRMCEILGVDFLFFHPAHPEESVCIDPLRNWNRKTELASRIAALIPSETGIDPFTAFGWKTLNDIVNGLIITGVRPNLVQLRRYIENGPDDLVVRALRSHFKDRVPNWEQRSAGFVKAFKGDILSAYIAFYKEIVIHEAPSVDLDGLVSTYEHNREHFQKMVAALIPILSMLTSDPLTDLLSPDMEPGHNRRVTDIARSIRNGSVLYVATDALADAIVGSAIGSIIMADTTAVAGDRYNYGDESDKPVNVFIDEAAEVINVPTIQLMNKGGGANFRVTIATQTFADFESRMGDKAKATQVLANTNNKIMLRVIDTETQQYFTDSIPQIKARTMSVRYGHDVIPNIHEEYSASYQETAQLEDADLIPSALLGELCKLHYFARLAGGRTLKGRVPILR